VLEREAQELGMTAAAAAATTTDNFYRLFSRAKMLISWPLLTTPAAAVTRRPPKRVAPAVTVTRRLPRRVAPAATVTRRLPKRVSAAVTCTRRPTNRVTPAVAVTHRPTSLVTPAGAVTRRPTITAESCRDRDAPADRRVDIRCHAAATSHDPDPIHCRRRKAYSCPRGIAVGRSKTSTDR